MVDPKRMVREDGTNQLGSMLRAAESDLLTEERVARVRLGLAAAIAIGPAAGAAIAKRALSTPAKIGIAVVAAGVVGSVAHFALWHEPPARAVFSAKSVAPAASPALSTARVTDLPAASALTAGGSTPRREAEVPLTAPSKPVVSRAPRPARLAPLPSSSATPISEGALLLEARRALDRDPALAAALVRAHQRQFPDSQLAPERARIAAEASKRLAR